MRLYRQMDERRMEKPLDSAEDWLDAYGARLVLYARQWVPTHADAEDAFQDGFVRFWKSGRGADDPKAYLYRCVRTAALDKLRRLRTRRVHEDAYKRHALLVSKEPEHDDTRETIEHAMAHLTTEQRELIAMKHWGGLTFVSIGTVLAINPRTAQSRYREAIRQLRQTLKTAEML